MSIKDGQDREIVSLPGFWELLAKFAFAASVPVLLLGISWAVWVTSMVWGHTTDIAVMREAVDAMRSRAGLFAKGTGKVAAKLREDEGGDEP